MIKAFFKETTIVLLLCIGILLVLGILFYDYNPITKVIPNKIAYTTPENIREELEEENVENSISIENKVYTIEDSDLTIYKKSQSYNPSKENPFATSDTSVKNTVSNSTIKTNDTQQNNQSGGQNNKTPNGNTSTESSNSTGGNKPSKLK